MQFYDLNHNFDNHVYNIVLLLCILDVLLSIVGNGFTIAIIYKKEIWCASFMHASAIGKVKSILFKIF